MQFDDPTARSSIGDLKKRSIHAQRFVPGLIGIGLPSEVSAKDRGSITKLEREERSSDSVRGRRKKLDFGFGSRLPHPKLLVVRGCCGITRRSEGAVRIEFN